VLGCVLLVGLLGLLLDSCVETLKHCKKARYRQDFQKRSPMKILGCFLSLLVATTSAWSQLAVTVSPPKVVGRKAIVPLALTNGLAENVESARAVVFLLDEQGKMMGQSTRWVIGGSKDKPGLAAGGTNAFNFVIASDKPFTTTSVTAKVTFSRVVLEGGKLAHITKDVIVTQRTK
jgi:hypothetical protein